MKERDRKTWKEKGRKGKRTEEKKGTDKTKIIICKKNFVWIDRSEKIERKKENRNLNLSNE